MDQTEQSFYIAPEAHNAEEEITISYKGTRLKVSYTGLHHLLACGGWRDNSSIRRLASRHPERNVAVKPIAINNQPWKARPSSTPSPRNWKLVAYTADGAQTVHVGPDCHAKIVAAGDEGYQPPMGGPRLMAKLVSEEEER